MDYLSCMAKELLTLLVPDYILHHFEYEKLEEISGVIRLHLTEKQDPNHYPKELIGKAGQKHYKLIIFLRY